MNGLGTCLVLFLVSNYLCSASLISGKNVKSDGVSEKENVKFYEALRVLNISRSRVLENLKQYEDSLSTSTLTGPQDVNATCSNAIKEVILGLVQGKIWALEMFDSGSAIQPGLLGGNLWDLGAFDECLAISVDDTDGLQFHGQHCLIQLQFEILGSSQSGLLAALGGSISYTFSMCLPSLCSPAILSNSLTQLSNDTDNILNRYNYSITFSVDSDNCHTAASKPLSPAEIAGIVVPAFFIGIAAICTLMDAIVVSSRRYFSKQLTPALPYVTAFSYLQNGKRLLDMRVSDESIQVLHSLKFICIAWVAIGHRFKLSVQGPLINTLKVTDYIKNWTTMLLLNAPLSVDVFFVISGILNTYSYLNSTSRGSKTVLAHVIGYVHRYVRLTPAYAMMILITATWLYRLGDGPYWDVLVGGARSDCTHNWWSGLLYINNYYNPDHNCMLQSWYLAVDMQLFWLSPLVLYSLWRWPRVGLAKIAVLVVVSIIIPFYVAYIDKIKAPIPMTLNQKVINEQMDELYMPTHTKTISYVLGMLGGYVIHQYKKKRMRIEINKWLNLTIWILALASMAYGIFGGYEFFQLDSAYNRVESSLYIAFYKLFWSVGIVWIIVACTTGHGGFINTFLSLKFWMPLGRLTYCIYLTHAAVILFTIGRLRTPQFFSYYTMVLAFLGELVIATFAAAILSLTIESPMMAIEKILRGGNRREKRGNGEMPQNKNSAPTNGSVSAINLPSVLTSD